MPVLDLLAWILLVIWASLLAGGLLFRKARARDRSLPSWILAASAVTLLLMAWYGYLLTRAGTDSARYALGVAGSITFHLLGGQLVAGAVTHKRTFFGISAIAFGYLLYAGAIAQYGAALGSVRLLVLSLWLLVGALAARTVLLRTRRRNPKQVSAAVAYVHAPALRRGRFATGLALTAPRFGVLAVGLRFLIGNRPGNEAFRFGKHLALLLASSDLILLFELSVCPSLLPDSRPSGEGKKGWLLPRFSSAARLLRAPGQALIVVSIWSALQDPISSQFSVFGS